MSWKNPGSSTLSRARCAPMRSWSSYRLDLGKQPLDVGAATDPAVVIDHVEKKDGRSVVAEQTLDELHFT
jgi:hypothetical protein